MSCLFKLALLVTALVFVSGTTAVAKGGSGHGESHQSGRSLSKGNGSHFDLDGDRHHGMGVEDLRPNGGQGAGSHGRHSHVEGLFSHHHGDGNFDHSHAEFEGHGRHGVGEVEIHHSGEHD